MSGRMPGLVPLMTLAMALGACGGNPAAQNLAAAKAFLADVARQPGVIRLPSGLEYHVLQSGPAGGHPPRASDFVVVNYEARLPTGEVLDSSYVRGQPDTFQVGALVPAWTQALQLMRPGSATSRQLYGATVSGSPMAKGQPSRHGRSKPVGAM